MNYDAVDDRNVSSYHALIPSLNSPVNQVSDAIGSCAFKNNMELQVVQSVSCTCDFYLDMQSRYIFIGRCH